MERKLNLKKGDKCIVAIEENSNASRSMDMSLDNIEKWTYKGEVVSVGRKYITVKFGRWNETEKFVIEDNYRRKYDCGTADYELYLSKEEIIEKRESEDIYYWIKCKFDSYKNNGKYSLDQLKRIKKIIEEE